jgi:hypothetical protein
MFRATAFAMVSIVLSRSAASAQTQPASDPQALAFAAQSIAAMAGNVRISDVTLTGSVTEWADTGTATLKALGTGEGRMDLSLPEGTRTEIRDAQTGIPLGQWINPNNVSGHFASQNCWTDAVWFFPVLGSLAAGPNVVLSYIGQETRNGGSVQHLQSYAYQSVQGPPLGPQHFSTMDFYLDATTLLPVAVTYNEHPDNSISANLLVEVHFANYQNIGGVTVPTHIQRYQQGALMIDITVSGAVFNTGLQLSTFAIN